MSYMDDTPDTPLPGWMKEGQRIRFSTRQTGLCDGNLVQIKTSPYGHQTARFSNVVGVRDGKNYPDQTVPSNYKFELSSTSNRSGGRYKKSKRRKSTRRNKRKKGTRRR